MTSYNMHALETNLVARGWTVVAAAFVEPDAVPGRVDHGGYTVDLVSPDGSSYHGQGATRTDAIRIAAALARVLPDDLQLS